MAVPSIVTDGNYKVPQQVGAGEWSTPFSDKGGIILPYNETGDQRTAELKIKYRVDQNYYKRTKPGTQIRVEGGGITYKGDMWLVHEGDTSDVGNGILEYTLTFSSLPCARVEFGTTNYARQELTTDGDIVTIAETVPCQIRYEYSMKPIPQIDAPRIEKIANSYFTYGNWGKFVPGNWYLAEDTENGIYKGPIYYRKSIYIRWKALTLRN